MAALTQDNIQDMWTKAVDILEKHRVYADATATNDGELDVLEQALRGEYGTQVTPVSSDFRDALAALATTEQALAFFTPLAFEYAKFISENAAGGTSGTGQGAGAQFLGHAQRTGEAGGVMRAIYEHMRDTSETVESRAITFDVAATTSNGDGGAIIGNGGITRLTADAEAFDLEACTIERKTFRCIADQNFGTKEEAEIFAVEGEAPPRDALGKNTADVLGQLGSGDLGTIRSLHAGGGQGGSLLTNSSFSTYTASTTSGEQFSGWTENLSSGGDDTHLTQDTTTFYRSFPNASTDASLKITVTAGAKYILTQALANMRVSRLDFDTPYFLRVMYKGDGTTAGTLKIRLGATEETVTVSGTTWKELFIAADKDTWPHIFNEDGFGIDIEYDDTGASAGGVLLIDDALFAPYTLIDGTYWVIRGNAATHTPWKLNDTLEFTDTGGAPATAEVQYWLYRAGLGFLPHTTGTPTWSEPS